MGIEPISFTISAVIPSGPKSDGATDSRASRAVGSASHSASVESPVSGNSVGSPTAVTTARCRMSRDDAPTAISNSPPSTTQRRNTGCQNARSRALNVNEIGAVAPASTGTFANPRSSRTGRRTELSRSPTYSWTTSWPGRFPVLVQLDSLSEEQLVQIMTEPRDALMRQYQRLFAMEGARLEATHDGLRALARHALTRNTGARGLRAVMEELLLETMFDLPSFGSGNRYVIDESAVLEGRPHRLSERTAA